MFISVITEFDIVIKGLEIGISNICKDVESHEI